jgi:glutaryl-CoA dehydrogenase
VSAHAPERPLDPNDLIDISSLLSDEELMIRDTVRQFIDDKVRPHIGQWYEDGVLPRHLIPEIGELGLFGMHLEGYGCAGTSAVAYGLACQELEAGDSGLRSLVSVQGSLAMFAIHAYGSEDHKNEWLPRMARGEAIGCFGLTESDFGSNPSGMRTNARRDGSDWIINGSKMWITNGTFADVAIVWARTDDGIRGFVVPTSTPGFSAGAVHGKLSLRASETGQLAFNEMRVPESAMLPGAKGLRGPLGCLSEARYGIIWGAMGAARDCLETAVAYSKSRIQFDRPIAGFQLTQQKLADMALEVYKGQLLALHLGRIKDSVGIHPEQVSIGKLNNVREAIEVARTARTILGGSGITIEYPVLRHANNLESVLTYEGTAEIHTLVVGQALTGVSAFR